MSRRTRYFGAVVSLLAFSAFFAESVWAAACDPDMESGMQHAAAASSPHAGMPMPSHSPGHTGSPHDTELPADAGSSAPSCPLAMTGGGGCVSSTLGAAAIMARFAAPESSTTLAAGAVHAELLVALTLFHPPRP